MNSKELRKKFKDVYRGYFSRCSTVVSAPHSFLWSGDFSGFYGGLTISSKIPLRFYVGIEEIGGDKVEVADQFPAYFAAKNQFCNINLDAHIRDAIAKIFSEKQRGIRINLLTEVPLGSSLGGLGTLSACLAMLCHPEHSEGSISTDSSHTFRMTDKDSLFPKAWNIAKKLQTGRTLGATAYTALSGSNYPIVFYTEGNKYWAKPLDSIAKLGKDPVWPIDFGLIFSGKLVQGAAVIASAEEVKRISEERETKLDFHRLTRNPFWTDYINFLKQISSQNLYALCDLFQKGAHENTLKYFFNTLNQYQNLLHFLEISNPEIDRIYGNIHHIANITENRVGSGAKITGVGKGGMVLFATSYGQYRETIEKEYGSSLIYASWRDGIIDDEAKIEQSVVSGLYSEFIDKSASTLTTFSQNEKSSRLISSDDLDKLDLDLIIDAYHQKIIIPGRILDSKDLPSQKSAAIILIKLLTSSDRQLTNNDLPGSYASSRFDLQSKITSPLGKLVDLDFEISGGMYDGFTLRLKRLDIKIGIVEKI